MSEWLFVEPYIFNRVWLVCFFLAGLATNVNITGFKASDNGITTMATIHVLTGGMCKPIIDTKPTTHTGRCETVIATTMINIFPKKRPEPEVADVWVPALLLKTDLIISPYDKK